LNELRELGLGRQLLLTGDRQSVAHSLARDVGISDVEAQALPEDKLNRVLKEIGSGFRPMVVGMASTIRWRSRRAWSVLQWARAGRISPWRRLMSC
jgi:hypothetical protein